MIMQSWLNNSQYRPSIPKLLIGGVQLNWILALRPQATSTWPDLTALKWNRLYIHPPFYLCKAAFPSILTCSQFTLSNNCKYLSMPSLFCKTHLLKCSYGTLFNKLTLGKCVMYIKVLLKIFNKNNFYNKTWNKNVSWCTLKIQESPFLSHQVWG